MYEKMKDCDCPQYREKGEHLETCKYFATKTRVVKAFSRPRKAESPDQESLKFRKK